MEGGNMSNWTHVAGIIRLDRIRILYKNNEPDFDEIIGKELLFTDSMEKWNDQVKNRDKYMPTGSEGSLNKSIWTDPDVSNMAAYTISIFGDLRDHRDNEEILLWFIDRCAKCNEIGSVRDAFILSRSEVDGIKTWTYGDHTNYDIMYNKDTKKWWVYDRAASRYIKSPEHIEKETGAMNKIMLVSEVDSNAEWLYDTSRMVIDME